MTMVAMTYQTSHECSEETIIDILVAGFSGRFGQVYEGMLQDNTRVAVKVLDTTHGEISRSFRREYQILKKIRHRNLIRIITICCRPEFNALVFPLMPNGSLEKYLDPSHRLDVVQLVRICSDVAEGMS